jgi:hypothetical protein
VLADHLPGQVDAAEATAVEAYLSVVAACGTYP